MVSCTGTMRLVSLYTPHREGVYRNCYKPVRCPYNERIHRRVT